MIVRPTKSSYLERIVSQAPVPDSKQVTRAQLQALAAFLHARGARIVFTNGCFDLLHVGHVRTLRAARSLGDVLVVGLNSDAGVRRLKGPRRPLVPQHERAELLAALECVSYVTIFDEETPIEVIRCLRPHVHVKGGDYDAASLPEAEAVRAGGGRVVILPLTPGRSTTTLENRLRSTADGAP